MCESSGSGPVVRSEVEVDGSSVTGQEGLLLALKETLGRFTDGQAGR